LLAYISPTHSLWNIPRRDGPKVLPKPKVQKITRKTRRKDVHLRKIESRDHAHKP